MWAGELRSKMAAGLVHGRLFEMASVVTVWNAAAAMVQRLRPNVKPSLRQGKVQGLLGKGDGLGNLQRLHPIRSVALSRHSSASRLAQSLKFQPASRHKPVAVVCLILHSCLITAKTTPGESRLPPALLASSSFHGVCKRFIHLVTESLAHRLPY